MCFQNLGIGESLLVPFSFDPFQCSADITIVVGVLSVCAATSIFFRVAATVKSSEKSGEGRRRAIYDEGTNVESSEKREILNGRERIPNAIGEGKGRIGRSNRSEKFGRRERVERRVIKRQGTASLRSFSFRLSAATFTICIVDDSVRDNKETLMRNYWQVKIDAFYSE